MSNVRDFGAKGDGQTDDTVALTHAIQRGDGQLVFGRGDYLITRPLQVPLATVGRISFDGSGGVARLTMAGAGPALHLIGSHKASAKPSTFAESVWTKERMPTVQGLEIVGRHAEADGIRIEGAMQPTLQGVLIRRCRHGVHLPNRNRNVLIANCHIYDNSGVGVFLDRLNLHQINVVGCHISYCKQGGIKVVGSEIRNFQITGNDIEYNFDDKADTSADILLDSRAGTLREGTIVSNTIQALRSPNGANVRLLGVGQGNAGAIGMFTISNNMIGDALTAIHLQSCRGVVVTGNCTYSGFRHSLRAEDCEHLVIGPNSIDHNPDYKNLSNDCLLLKNCRNVTMTGLNVEHIRAPEEAAEASITIDGCQDVSLTGCHILGARAVGVLVRASSVVRVADCTIKPRAGDRDYQAALSVDAQSTRVMAVNNFLAKGTAGASVPPELAAGGGNVVL